MRLQPTAECDDDDSWTALAQRRNQAVHIHAGQLPPKQQDIGTGRLCLLEKAFRIDGFPHNFEIGLAL